uniref:Nuclear GTPase SLIP-GC n=1 Tax=Pogona vitticeps TaxID=103695 RepID=A0ABM5FBF8_9SAUR
MASLDPNASTAVRNNDEEMEFEAEEPRAGPSGLPETTAPSLGEFPQVQGAAEGGTPERTVRRKRKYQAFESEEKDRLKQYDMCESKARRILLMTYGKLIDVLSRGNMPEEMNYLKERLDALKKKTSLEPLRIGFLGRTGAGKTSLLNALLGRKLFLPVSGNQTCTSCIVQVKGSQSEQYEATVHLLSQEEWRDELKNLVKILQKNKDDEDDDSFEECVNDATRKLRALYGTGADQKSYEELLKAKLQVTIPAKRTIQLKEKEVGRFSEALKPYIRVGDDHPNQCWPLIKYVELALPLSEMVPEGITFIDIPGTGDFNRKRDEMWKQNIDKCSVIWIIIDMEHAIGDRDQQILLDESIKAYLAGNCTDIAVVVTKSDKLDLDEYRSERNNVSKHSETFRLLHKSQRLRGLVFNLSKIGSCPVTSLSPGLWRHFQTQLTNEHDAILERNGDTKRKVGANIREKLKRRLPPDSEVIQKQDLVYTVSAKEFWNRQHLNQEETEIPELRKYIRKLSLREKKRLVMEYVKEISSILLLAENTGSREQLVEQHFRESGIEEFVNRQIAALGRRIAKCFDQIKDLLPEGVEEAKRSYVRTVLKFLNREKGYKGFHQTLRAVCVKNGVYASKSFARIDLNEDLARPIYNKIGSSFGSIFRTQKPTRGNLWFQLEEFKREVQEKIRYIARDHRISENGKVKAFIHEIDVILLKLKEEILQEKLIIYKTLPLSIQSDLRKHYEAASNVSGRKSCDKMKKILREGTQEEVVRDMFEKATSNMISSFTELKEKILRTLNKEMSIVRELLLLQQEQLALQLPDIKNECREIQQILRTLQQDTGMRTSDQEASS